MFSARQEWIEGVELRTVADVAAGVRQLCLDVEAADGCSAGSGLGVALKDHQRCLTVCMIFVFRKELDYFFNY
jgi:hypothetical protein